MSTQLDRIEEKVKSIDDAVNGNGKKGLKERMGKAELVLKVVCWVSGVIFVAIAGLVGKVAYDIIKHAC